MQALRIAQAQINTTVGDLPGNLDLIRQGLEHARQCGAQLVTFPELAVCGYPPEDLLLKPRFLQDNQAALEALAPHSTGLTAVVGFAGRLGQKAANCAAILHDGALAGVYCKRELPNYGVFDEMRYFAAGDECLVIQLGPWRLMPTVCEDLWIPGNTIEACALATGTQVILNISASPFHAGKLGERKDLLAAWGHKTGAYVCYNNLVGGQDELVFDGGGLISAPDGRILAEGRRFAEDFSVVDLPLAAAPPLSADASPRVLSLTLAPASPARPALAPSPAPEEQDQVAEVYDALVLGCRDYLGKNGFKKAVLGLSGGIDSALTAVLACQALGPENVVGVTMPSQYTSRETRGDAELLAANLGITLYTLPVKGVLSAYLAELAPVTDGQPSGLTEENLQARIRGNYLMALSNHFGWIVLTTGNKSETAVGYCTIYGDMAGGFAVIKDVPKTLVYELSRLANRRAGRELIPASTLEREPSAELRPDQKDSDSLPPYEVLDPILKAYVEQDLSADEIVALGYPADMVRRVVRLVDLNEYKRRQAPPGIKITPKAFGKDRRLPITSHYRPGQL